MTTPIDINSLRPYFEYRISTPYFSKTGYIRILASVGGSKFAIDTEDNDQDYTSIMFSEDQIDELILALATAKKVMENKK